MATMLCVPVETYVAVQMASPAFKVTVAQPVIVVPLSVNATVPLVAPVDGAVRDTVAVKITLCPTTAGFADDVVTVAVAAVPTICATGADVLVAKFASPPYMAVNWWVAA